MTNKFPTSIIQLDSSPSQHRKQYHHHHHHQTQPSRTYLKSSDEIDYYQHHHRGPSWNKPDGMNSLGRCSTSISSRQSFSTLTSPDLSSSWKNPRHHFLLNHNNNNIDDDDDDEDDEINRKPLKIHPNHRQHQASSSLNHLESIPNNNLNTSINNNSTNQDNTYFNLSNFTSHSETGSFQNITSSSNKSCDKYGFFLEESEESDQAMTPSIQDLKDIRIKEKKWLQMLNNWRYYINFKWDKIRDRCRKGIPHSLRSQAWFHLCGAHLQKNRHPNLYAELLLKDIPDDVRNDIYKDLHRQFPNHEMFANPDGHGQADLYNVLKAFAAYRPNMGYCQAQAPIAAVFLMHMPAERAFWCLVALSRYYISGYFQQNLEDIQIHGLMLFSFMKKYCHSAYDLLHRQNIEPVLYMTEWFMCIYSRNLPWPSVLRVWDMFLCEGLTVLFKVGLYMVEVALKNENKKSCPTMYETCQKLRNIPKQLLREDLLIKGIRKFEISDIDLLKEHKAQSKKFLKSKNNKKQQ